MLMIMGCSLFLLSHKNLKIKLRETEETEYFTELNPFKVINFYRLKLICADGLDTVMVTQTSRLLSYTLGWEPSGRVLRCQTCRCLLQILLAAEGHTRLEPHMTNTSGKT